MPGSELVQSTLHACDLLGEIAGRDGVRLQEISESLGLKPPRTHNLLRTLAARGFVVQDSGGRWHLGDAPRELVERDCRRALLARAALEFNSFRATIPGAILILAEPRANRIEVVLRASPDRPGVIQHPQNLHLSPYGSAVGLACLAFGDALTAIHLRENHPFEEAGAPLWPNRAVLDRFLDKAKRKGSLATPFRRQEAVRVAAPVFDSTGRFQAALGAALPAGKCTAGDIKRLENRIVAAAGALSERRA